MTRLDAADSEHRSTRDTRLKWAILSSILVRPLAVLIPILVLPVFVRYLGVNRYGLFETVSSLAVWIGLSNFGLGFGLRNRLMDCHISGDQLLARKYVSTLFSFMSILFCVLLGAVTLITLLIPWVSIFHAQGISSLTELRWAVFTALTVPLLGMTISYAPSIYTAYQEIHRQNLWEGIGKIATVTACLLVPTTSLGISGAILALAGTSVIVALANEMWLWFVAKPWLRPSFALFDRTLLRALVHDGFLLFILQSAAVALFQVDRVVIALFRSPREVAEYAAVNRCFMLAYGGFLLVLGPLWPAYGEAFRRGDIQWCTRKLRLSLVIGLGCLATTMIVLLTLRQPIFSLLGGTSKLMPGRALIVGMSVACLCRVWADCHSVLLNGANVLRVQALLLGCNAVVAIAFNVLATKLFGNVGTVWSFPLAAALTTLWGYPWMVRKYVTCVMQRNLEPTELEATQVAPLLP